MKTIQWMMISCLKMKKRLNSKVRSNSEQRKMNTKKNEYMKRRLEQGGKTTRFQNGEWSDFDFRRYRTEEKKQERCHERNKVSKGGC